MVAAVSAGHGAGRGPGIPRGPQDPDGDQRRKSLHLPPVARIRDDLRAFVGRGAGDRRRADAARARSALPASAHRKPASAPPRCLTRPTPARAARLHVVLAPDLPPPGQRANSSSAWNSPPAASAGCSAPPAWRALSCPKISAWWNGSPPHEGRARRHVVRGPRRFPRTARRARRPPARDARPRGPLRSTPPPCARRCAPPSTPMARSNSRPVARRQPRACRRWPRVAAATRREPDNAPAHRPGLPAPYQTLLRKSPAACPPTRPPRSSAGMAEAGAVLRSARRPLPPLRRTRPPPLRATLAGVEPGQPRFALSVEGSLNQLGARLRRPTRTAAPSRVGVTPEREAFTYAPPDAAPGVRHTRNVPPNAPPSPASPTGASPVPTPPATISCAARTPSCASSRSGCPRSKRSPAGRSRSARGSPTSASRSRSSPRKSPCAARARIGSRWKSPSPAAAANASRRPKSSVCSKWAPARAPAQRQARRPARRDAQRPPGSPARLRPFPAAPRRVPAPPIPGCVPRKHAREMGRRRRALVGTIRATQGRLQRPHDQRCPPRWPPLRPYQRKASAGSHSSPPTASAASSPTRWASAKPCKPWPTSRPCARPGRRPPPSLVVCPTSLVDNWRREAAKFTPELRPSPSTAPTAPPLFAQIAAADLVITSYALLRRDLENTAPASSPPSSSTRPTTSRTPTARSPRPPARFAATTASS